MGCFSLNHSWDWGGFSLDGAALNEEVIDGSVDWDDERVVNSGLTLIALTGIEDPVRPEVWNEIMENTIHKISANVEPPDYP